jgi:Flp pilus assembly protein TadG
MPKSSRFGSSRGSAAVEAGLLLPWMVLSFVAVIDFGFCGYGLIAVQNAARIGAVWGAATSANAQSGTTLTNKACTYALNELRYAPNVGSSVTTCGGISPISVNTSYLSAAQSADKQNAAVSVTVNFSVPMVAIPAIMPSTMVLTRTVQLPVRN